MPAILAVPLVAVFGQAFPQTTLAYFLGAGLVLLTHQLSLQISKSYSLAIWSSLLAGAGSIVWFLSSVGSSWYLGQITAAFFLTAALVETFGQKRAFYIGVLVGAAFLSRVHLILTVPFFGFFLVKKNWKKSLTLFALGLLPFVIFNFSYNWIRFGTVLDKGYLLIPGLFTEPWYQKGLFHLVYLPRHLKVILTALPLVQSSFPYLKPSWAGLAIWLTTPAFIYSLRAPIKQAVVKLSWLTIGLICLVIFSHGTTGFSQFGYRFAVDFYPFLFFLTIKGVAQTGLRWHHWILLVLGVMVNLWGVIWINHFGWVSF